MPRTEIQFKGETPRLEDYLEAIYHLIHERGYAGTVDISESLQVKPPAVSSMIQKLSTRGYLVYEPYRGMTLTEKGEKIARSVISKHAVISEFLSMIGVEKRAADEDAEGIEHYMHPMTIHKIERTVDFLRRNPTYLTAIMESLGT